MATRRSPKEVTTSHRNVIRRAAEVEGAPTVIEALICAAEVECGSEDEEYAEVSRLVGFAADGGIAPTDSPSPDVFSDLEEVLNRRNACFKKEK
jgi:hypothetical protein